MPEAKQPPDNAAVLAELAERGGDVGELTRQAHSDGAAGLQAALKALGYSKLGERARVMSALKAAAAESAEAVAPAAASKSIDEAPVDLADATMVMHGAVIDFFDDGGLLKTTLRAGDKSLGSPPQLSRCKVRYTAAVLPECRRFEAVVTEFQMGEEQVPRGLEKCVASMTKGETCELIARSECAPPPRGTAVLRLCVPPSSTRTPPCVRRATRRARRRQPVAHRHRHRLSCHVYHC